MKHHFADFLDRKGDYWSITPNSDRHRSTLSDANPETQTATIQGNDKQYEAILDMPNIEEVTFHEPSKDQLAFISKLTDIKRLRITHARSKSIGFLESLGKLEELVLEYVSGFNDLSPIGTLPKLKSLHTENLRKVKTFNGLSGSSSLRFLSIYGTLDWKQPINDFNFLKEMPNLEVLSLFQLINNSDYPATMPILSLRNIQEIKINWSILTADEYALMEVGLPNVKGTDWGPYRKFKRSEGEVWYEFTGKGSGATKVGSKTCEARCTEFSKKYDLLKELAKKNIAHHKI